MTTRSLASVDDLCDTAEEKRAFEQNRRPVTLVDLANEVDARFDRRDLDWSTLFSYVVKHWEVLPILLEAPGAIRGVFGEVRPILELVTDPEEGWEELFIVVPTRETISRALARLKQLDAIWFVRASRRAGFAVNVTIELRV
jgi:hypothetical protein